VSGPAPAVAAVRAAVRGVLRGLPDGALVLVACSGGADSLALAAATAFEAPRAGLRAGAVVVDHGWHDGSAAVAAAAAATCAGLGLDPAHVVDVTVHAAAGRGGPEAAARDARYAALESAARAGGASLVLLGHTLDDQAETVLLGLARGSGARSLAGMPARRGVFARPFLAVPRAVTRAACAGLGLTPHEDPSNHDPGYARARVRAAMEVLEAALGPGLVPALARTAGLLAEDAAALEGSALELAERARRPGGYACEELARAADAVRRCGGYACEELARAADAVRRCGGYACETLAAAPDAVRRRALLAAAREAGSPAGALGSRHVLALDALVVRWRGQGAVHLPGGVVAGRRCGTLWFAAPGPSRTTAPEHPFEQRE
jgi:tRNA(Ile)-lysidine synthase